MELTACIGVGFGINTLSLIAFSGSAGTHYLQLIVGIPNGNRYTFRGSARGRFVKIKAVRWKYPRLIGQMASKHIIANGSSASGLV